MWIVVKYKFNELNILKDRLKEMLGNEPEYFMPKIKYTKIVKKKYKILQKFLLEGYLIFFHEKFDNNNIINALKNTRGVSYVLDGFRNNQHEILCFVNKCKSFEDKNGFIKQDFFDYKNFKKGKFISGPFTNLVFDILSKNSDKIEILIGKYKSTIFKNSAILYRPI
tara:strand:- start:2676 stop:3176 length:501 start_codon:yes stop_codon:yes gene_type:complete